MDVERYQALLCAIERGSLTAAAEELGYTASGISRMMAALEEENGFSLLIRGKDGVTPTRDCMRILPYIHELVFHGEKLKQISAQIRGMDIGSVTIGTAYSAYYGWLARVTSLFHRKYPGIEIKIINDYSSKLLEQVKEHQTDLVLISEREGNHLWIPLHRDRLLAMLPSDHKLAQLSAVPIEAFAEEPYIDTYPGLDIDNSRVFQRCHITPNTQFSTMDIYATCSMVEAGLGISMNNELNSTNWNGEIKLLPLLPPQSVMIGLAAAADRTPAAQTFLDFVQPFLAEIAD